MRKIIALTVFALAGCVDPTAQQPQYNPAMAKIRQACDAGDVDACKVIVQAQQRPTPRPYQPVQIVQPVTYWPAMTGGPTTTNCRNNFGQVTCTTY